MACLWDSTVIYRGIILKVMFIWSVKIVSNLGFRINLERWEANFRKGQKKWKKQNNSTWGAPPTAAHRVLLLWLWGPPFNLQEEAGTNTAFNKKNHLETLQLYLSPITWVERTCTPSFHNQNADLPQIKPHWCCISWAFHKLECQLNLFHTCSLSLKCSAKVTVGTSYPDTI